MLRRLPTCTCGVTSDAEGYHLVTCSKDGGVVRRHDEVQNAWLHMLKSVNYHCVLEEEHLFKSTDRPDDKKRPDISIYNFKDGKKLLLDISIVHPQAKHWISGSAKDNGFAAAGGDRLKNQKYAALAQKQGYLFQPVVSEVFGRWSPVARGIFSFIARRPSADFEQNKAAFINYWRRRLSICLQKENANIILRKIKLLTPSSVEPLSQSAADTQIRAFSFAE